MPAAGLHIIHTDRLTFRRDGVWYADSDPVLHPRLASLFSRHLRRKVDGGFEIWIDERFHADVDVEDTPFVVTTVHEHGDGNVVVELNDGTCEPLQEDLLVSSDDSLSCVIKGGQERARFLRAAQNQLAAHLESSASGFQLRFGEKVYAIRAVSPQAGPQAGDVLG